MARKIRCKKCGELDTFDSKRIGMCRTCWWMSKSEWSAYWSNEEVECILRFIYSHDISQEVYINNVCSKLKNKTSHDVALLLRKQIKFMGGSYKIRIMVNCAECNIEFPMILSQYLQNKNSFCSRECINIWQSKNVSGKNHPLYNRVDVECEWCGKIKPKKQSSANRKQHQFCSRECSNAWFREVFSKSKKNREFHRLKVIKQIERGDFKETLTKPHLAINDLLDDMKIRFDNEKIYYKQSIDIYLKDYDIPIEIMGTYWHIDPRFYNKIEFEQQAGSPRKDKIKHSYIKNNHNKEILYLWEYDIENDIDICRNMILDYISNGKLHEYHSFNYCAENRITPFMEMDSEDVKSLTNIFVREKRSMKQLDKWSIIVCPQCGNPFERLTSHLKKGKTNCCSNECRVLYQMKQSPVVCENCYKIYNKKNSDIRRNKTGKFYCTDKCKNEYRAKNKYMDVKCSNCGKPLKRKPSQIKESKSGKSFCNSVCTNEYRSKNNLREERYE